MASSVIPKPASISFCPSAVAPPWLPMAGTMNGSAPRRFTASTTALVMMSTLRIPRLPAVMAMIMPGLIFSEKQGWAICCSTTAGICSGAIDSRGNV